jgi:hypothetical protein
MSDLESPPPATPFGSLPPWGEDDLPEPLPFSPRNVMKTIGPGAILLAASIGGGEWLVGPTMAVQHGTGVFWIATIGIILQLLFNLEAIRYTLYTGEPILTGIMRLKPGSKFWATIYVFLAAAQLGLPALGIACGSVLFASVFGQVPGNLDGQTLLYFTYGVILLAAAILLFGGTIERMLEIASWGMIAYIFLFLIVVNVFFVPLANWGRTARGFVEFGQIPEGVDLLLLATLAATAGSGGIGNLTISNWARDKGFGMGAKVGAITSALGSDHIQLSHVGKVFPTTPENLRRWKLWWKYVEVDQIWLWALGCFLGMFLNVNLATAIMPPGTKIDGIAAGTFQAHYLAEQLGPLVWYLALLNGFWILFSTHLGNTDVMVRTITDTVWVASKQARAWKGGSISKIYYAFLLAFTAWMILVAPWKDAMSLFKILGTIAGFVLALAAIQILIVNTRLLPPELRPPLWRRFALVACALFYGTFFVVVLGDQIRPYW